MSAPIIVGYDGSEGAEAALARAIEEASEASAELVVVAVAPMPVDPGISASGVLGPLGDMPVTMLPLVEPPEVERLLGLARDRIEAAGVAGDYVWDAGDPAEAIVREAQARGAGLVVVGKGHHSRLGRWLGTDVAAEVERAAGCPVIVVEH